MRSVRTWVTSKMSLADVITADKQEALGRDLRASGFSEAADIIDKLVDFARDEIYLLDETDRALRMYVQADRDMHVTYGSTATCSGGAGGMAMTPHCAHICHNTAAHRKEERAYSNAALQALEAIEKVRNA